MGGVTWALGGAWEIPGLWVDVLVQLGSRRHGGPRGVLGDGGSAYRPYPLPNSLQGLGSSR